MSMHALHQGIQYKITEIRPGEWRWSFTPPAGASRSCRVVGEIQWTIIVAQRAIEVWHLMNRTHRNQAA